MLTHVYVEVDKIIASEGVRTYGYVVEAEREGDAPNHTVEGFGSVRTTSRGAYLAGLAAALGRFRKAAEVHVHMADAWLLGCMENAVDNWAANDWKTKNGKPVKHREYWERIREAKRSLFLVPEAERYSAYSKWLLAEIAKRVPKEDEDV